MSQKSLDTSVVIRWLLDDVHDQHLATKALIESDQKLQLADVALNEIVFVLEKVALLERNMIAEFITAITERRNINCNRTLLTHVLPLYVQHPKLSFTDCSLAVYVELNNAAPLLTFDRKLAAQMQAAELVIVS
ncbi:MAG TPA: PIN domain-containing protein [Candidatus Acidoferrum sp.]|nr:PIN domain-containing protein [Candidatus Acidoferrum sp.]